VPKARQLQPEIVIRFVSSMPGKESAMGELLESLTGGAIWGLGFAVGLAAIRATGRGLRPVIRTAVKGAVAATEWAGDAAAEGRETVTDIYHEAKAEVDRETVQDKATV
jgi:hypothetical protein